MSRLPPCRVVPWRARARKRRSLSQSPPSRRNGLRCEEVRPAARPCKVGRVCVDGRTWYSSSVGVTCKIWCLVFTFASTISNRGGGTNHGTIAANIVSLFCFHCALDSTLPSIQRFRFPHFSFLPNTSKSHAVRHTQCARGRGLFHRLHVVAWQIWEKRRRFDGRLYSSISAQTPPWYARPPSPPLVWLRFPPVELYFFSQFDG